MKCLQPLSVSQSAIQFWWRGLPAIEMIGLLDYMDVWDVTSAHPGFTDVVSNVTLVSVNEVVYANGVTENG